MIQAGYHIPYKPPSSICKQVKCMKDVPVAPFAA